MTSLNTHRVFRSVTPLTLLAGVASLTAFPLPTTTSVRAPRRLAAIAPDVRRLSCAAGTKCFLAQTATGETGRCSKRRRRLASIPDLDQPSASEAKANFVLKGVPLGRWSPHRLFPSSPSTADLSAFAQARPSPTGRFRYHARRH